MSPATLMLVSLAVIVLLPIVPAYLLFKFLPSRGDVSGLLQGLELKLGGAFAGYFALVVLILFQMPRLKDTLQDTRPEIWEVEGQLTDENGNAIQPLSPADIQLEPQNLNFKPNGEFRATFATTVRPDGIGFEFPKIYVSHKDYGTVTISLGPPETADVFQKQRDQAHHHISLNPVKLTKPPSYSPSGQPPIKLSTPPYSSGGSAISSVTDPSNLGSRP
jgi:hypothetical protein